jgi:branched-chain amino acid transport system substrate-binding protein
MFKPKIWLIATTLGLSVVVGGIMTSAVQAANEIILGATLAKTGPYSTTARTSETAIDLAVEEINKAGGINGMKIKLIKFDTGGDPKQAQVAVKRFATDHRALAVIGPFASSEARVAFPAGERIGIVQIPNASSAPKLADKFSYAFRLTESEFVQFTRLIVSMKRKGLKIDNTQIVYVSDEFVSKIVGTKLMPVVFKMQKVEVKGAPVSFATAAFDISPQITKLAQSPAQNVAVAGIVEATVKVAKELRRQGHMGRIIGSGLSADPDLAGKLGKDGDGTLYTAWFWKDRNARTKAFTAKFNALNKKRGITKANPHHVDASAYDIVYLLKAVMEKAKITGDPSKLVAERTAIRDTLKTFQFSGVTGDICFDKNGDAELPAYVMEVINSDVRMIDQHPSKKCK